MRDAQDFNLDKVVHNLTHRRFKKTSRESVYQLGSSVANSFYDPRNIGNFEAGEIAPEGRFATHYPVNAGSNTMGFTIMDDAGDDRREFYPSTISSNVNALVMEHKDGGRMRTKKMKGGALGSSSSGSSSDYMFFNPYYEALLNPASHTIMEDVAQPHYIPVSYENEVMGRGTNAPSSGSAVDFAMNNPYAFKSNFNGGSLGASSSGSSSDYFDSNPFRVPAIQSEGRHFSEFMMEGGAIDWAKYLGYLRKGINYIPTIIEKGPAVLKKTASTLETIQELRDLLRGKEEKKGKAEPKQKAMPKPKAMPKRKAMPKSRAEENIMLDIVERQAPKPKSKKASAKPKKTMRTMDLRDL